MKAESATRVNAVRGRADLLRIGSTELTVFICMFSATMSDVGGPRWIKIALFAALAVPLLISLVLETAWRARNDVGLFSRGDSGISRWSLLTSLPYAIYATLGFFGALDLEPVPYYGLLLLGLGGVAFQVGMLRRQS